MAEHLECSVNDLLGYDDVDNYNVFETYQASEMFIDKDSFARCFGDRLSRYLKEKGLSAINLADLTKISVSTIKRWTSKHPTLPQTIHLLHICDALDCTPSELLGY